MGTATTMNSLAEALGMSLPGSAAIPAPYRDRQEISYHTGKRIVEMVAEDLKPSDILTRAAFENAIVVNSAIGGSTNAPIHLNAIARHIGVDLPHRRLAGARPQGAAARQSAADGRISRRGLLSRRRRARGGGATDEGRA
jgi:dihydroxyacid dehydratase/phosphogluconate dehydratase